MTGGVFFIILFIVGIISMALGLIKGHRRGALSIGFLSLDLSLTMFAQNELSQIVFFSPLILSYIWAFGYFLVPAFMAWVVYEWFDHKISNPVLVILCVSLGSMICAFVLSGITDLLFIEFYPSIDVLFIDACAFDRSLGYSSCKETDIPVPAMETRQPSDTRARFKDEILAVCTQLAEDTRAALVAGEWPLVIGGDHSIAMGTVSGLSTHLKAQGEKLGLIWFDAHGDMNLPGSSPSGNIHGMPLAHLLGYGDTDLSSIPGASPAVDCDNVVLIGIRDIDDVERAFIRESGVTAFTMRDIDQLGMLEVATRALEVVNRGTAGFHVSFDLDGCDPDVIPGPGTTVPGGVSFREAQTLANRWLLIGLSPATSRGNAAMPSPNRLCWSSESSSGSNAAHKQRRRTWPRI